MRQMKISKKITDKNPTIEQYLREIGRFPLLTPEAEVELAEKIKSGDSRALNILITRNLRFVVSIAKQYQNQGLPLLDLVGFGNIGLITAAKRFDHTRGFKFISYAVWWIRQSILENLAEFSRIVRLPQNKNSICTKANKAIEHEMQTLEREPTNEELAEVLEISEKHIQSALTTCTHHKSLDEPIHIDEEQTLGDLLQSEHITDSNLHIEDLRKELSFILKKLKPREEAIIRAYFKLDGEQTQSIEEVAKNYGINSNERIRQIKEKCIGLLRKPAYLTKLRPYL